MARLTIETAEEMHELGIRIAKLLRAGDLLVLTGALGAGKTTFTRGLGEGLEAIGTVSSPTFVIARTHKLHNRQEVLVHVDAYRLGSAAELDDLDIDFENSIVVVEWGKGLLDGISENYLDIEIERDHTADSDVRQLELIGNGDRWSKVQF